MRRVFRGEQVALRFWRAGGATTADCSCTKEAAAAAVGDMDKLRRQPILALRVQKVICGEHEQGTTTGRLGGSMI